MARAANARYGRTFRVRRERVRLATECDSGVAGLSGRRVEHVAAEQCRSGLPSRFLVGGIDCPNAQLAVKHQVRKPVMGISHPGLLPQHAPPGCTTYPLSHAYVASRQWLRAPPAAAAC